jgi:TonB-dependent starch-binding outer membrane protein SusC
MKKIINHFVNFSEFIVSSNKLLAMKFTVLLILVSFFKVSANYSQENLTVKMENTPIKSILKEIERQTEFTFLYDNSKVNVNQEKTVTIENKSIENVLDELFSNTQIEYKIKGKQILLSNHAEGFLAQKIQVTGKVVSSDKQEPLPGVVVTVKGTSVGSVTDLDGNFKVDVPDENAVLVFQYVGYLNEEVLVGTNRNITVSLVMDITNLDEVVVVGYGTMRKGDLTGAIASVNADDLNKGVITTTEQVLQGKVAGLTVLKGSGDPTAGATMRLRGATSLSASSTPLVVVDGIPGVDINTVAPSDIESIDVLKDASSAAIYGSRGANGVIIITTKKPKSGKKVEYNSSAAWGWVSNHIDMLTADEYRALPEKDPKIKIKDFGGNTDWVRAMEQRGFTQSHDISLSTGNEDGGMHAAINYLDSKGVIITSNLKRIGLNVNGYTYGLNKKLRIELGTHTTFDSYHPVNYSFFEHAYNQNPTLPIKDSNGVYYGSTAIRDRTPIEELKTDIHDNTTKRILGYAKAELEFIDGLKGVVSLSDEYNSRQERIYVPKTSQRAQDGQIAQRGLNDYNTQQLESYLNYTKDFNGAHHLNMMGGYSYLNTVYEDLMARTRDFITDITEYNSLQSGKTINSGDVTSKKYENTMVSFYGRLNYSYKGKYVITATLRRDGSSKFGINKKWGTFASYAFAWNVSDEAFMASTKGWLNNLKLRVGYGETGSQDAIPQYSTLALYSSGSGKYYNPLTNAWESSYSISQNSNPYLKWESTTQVNAGIDFSIFDRLRGTVEVYNKITNGLIYKYDVPTPPYPYGQMLANVGNLSNKGVELTLNTYLLKTNDFQWDVDLSLAKNKLVVDKLSNDQFKTDKIMMGDLIGINGLTNAQAQILYEGGSVGTFWLQECSGLDTNGKFLNVNGDVLSSKDDSLKKDMGNAQPKLTVGLSTRLSYKKWDLNISTYGIFGQKVYNATAMVLYDYSRIPTYNAPSDYLEKGIKSAPTMSSYWLEDASFFRIQSVSLGYTFEMKNAYISRLRLYASGENLLVFTKYSGIDPEINIENAGGVVPAALNNPGIDRFNMYPRARTFSLGLNVTF